MSKVVRGTTPTFTLTLPFNAEAITILSVAFAQNEKVLINKTLNDVLIAGKQITITLTENETLLFEDKSEIELQLRCGIGDKRYASCIMHCSVEGILVEGALS